ncbi:MAG: hypothetical protein DRO73_10615 [Candidatus Thorarchaeota archaeon]|nr:MAG: hypothetical protein DRO73_10615 [Candidatus Thorarchaeota archaeon]RLI61758.1 MAG: hypothetical protein DRO93_03380 [Candidatus Thorarchaeota archaeon]
MAGPTRSYTRSTDMQRDAFIEDSALGVILTLGLEHFISHASLWVLIRMLRPTTLSVLLVGAIILGGMCAFVMPVAAGTVTIRSSNDQVTVSVKILDAYYTDADDDGYEDDVVALFDIYLDGAVRYNIDIYPELVLPSGESFLYGYTINTRLSTLHCTMYFLHHATETGNYTFSVDVVSYTGGVATGQVNYVFDPPGGSGDADPCAVLEVAF